MATDAAMSAVVPASAGGVPTPSPMPPAPMAGMQMPAIQKMYDVKLKRCVKSGQIKVAVLPPEDFLIDASAITVDENDGRFYADATRMTRSKAKLRWPKKKDLIDELSAYTTATDDGAEKQARENRFWSFRDTATDKASEEIEVFECYVNIDYDGDGVTEWRQVCMAGGIGERHILSNEEWGGPLPYVSVTPAPMPHRYRGRSLFDDVGDVQRIKTVLLRQMLDNLYLANNPTVLANSAAVENKDALINPEVGGVVWTNGAPGDTVIPFAVPFVAKDIFPVLEYFDMLLEKRTGVSRSTMALDLDALQNQTATAVNAQQAAAYTKVETYARNISECGGFKKLFGNLLRLFVENQKSVKHIRLRDQFIPLDPRGWNAEMDVTINVGLGAGSRDRDLATLNAVAQKQELAIQASGNPYNPVLNIGHLFGTYRKMAEAAMLKNPEQYFPEITQEQVQQIGQQAAQSQPPSPEAQKAQAQMQIEQMKLQANMQLAQAQMQADAQRDALKAQADQQAMAQKAEIEKIQAQADIATNERKVQAEIVLNERKFALERELKIAEHQMKMQEMQAQQVQREREAEIRFAESANSAVMAREGHDQKLELADKAAKAKAQQPRGPKK